MFKRALGLAIGVGILMVSCSSGGSDEPSSLVSDQKDTTADISDGSEDLSASEEATRRVARFELTTADGWHFSGEIPFPNDGFLWSTDISEAPPGSTDLVLTGSINEGDQLLEYTFSNDDPGREGAATLVTRPPYLVFEMPDAEIPDFGAGACEIRERQSFTLEDIPITGDPLVCMNRPQQSAETPMKTMRLRDLEESVVEDLADHLNSQEPGVVFNVCEERWLLWGNDLYQLNDNECDVTLTL